MAIQERNSRCLGDEIVRIEQHFANLDELIAKSSAEAALTKLESIELALRYRMLLENCRCPITYLDRDGRILFVNELGAANLGESTDVVGKTLEDFFPPEAAELYLEQIRDVMDTGETTTQEALVKLPSGDQRWFWSIIHPLQDSTGVVHGVQIVSHDVTDHKRVEEDLEERLRFEQFVAKLASEFVNRPLEQAETATTAALRDLGRLMKVDRSLLFEFSADHRQLDCRFEWYSESVTSAADRLQGQSAEQFPWCFCELLCGKPIVASHLDELPEEAENEREVFQQHSVVSTIAVPIIVGCEVWGALCLDRVQYAGDWRPDLAGQLTAVGQIMGASIVRMRAEQELRQRREQLIHVARLSTVGELVGGIAHEISQPLYSILNYAKAVENVLREPDPKRLEEAAEWAQRISKSASQAGEIIHRLRCFSHNSTERTSVIRAEDVVQEALELVGHEARKHGVDFRCEVEDPSLTVKVDRVHVQQVVVNLLQNAIEALDHAGDEDRTILIRAARDGEQVEFSIVDHGKGLPADANLNIFDAFVSTKSGGLGMGLAISKRLVEERGGQLRAERNSDKGTAVQFTLPAGGDSDES